MLHYRKSGEPLKQGTPDFLCSKKGQKRGKSEDFYLFEGYNLPSFFPKYKDISMINNCELLTSHHSKLKYVPANNPFEAYNFLDAVIDETEQVCTAPLSTKPVALGVCLYALNHPNLRVVYPVSEQYRHHNTNRVHKSYLYEIPLKCP